MKTLRTSLLVSALVLAFATIIPASPLQEEILLEGTLIAIDLDSKTLSVKTSAGEELRVKYTDELRVAGQDESVASLKEKVGTPVKIHYKLVEEMPQAVRIEAATS
jgi:hypothetical protein